MIKISHALTLTALAITSSASSQSWDFHKDGPDIFDRFSATAVVSGPNGTMGFTCSSTNGSKALFLEKDSTSEIPLFIKGDLILRDAAGELHTYEGDLVRWNEDFIGLTLDDGLKVLEIIRIVGEIPETVFAGIRINEDRFSFEYPKLEFEHARDRFLEECDQELP